MARNSKKSNLQLLTVVVFLLIALNGTAAAAPSTLYVDAEGSGNYTTIQAAINNASSGDTILVFPGTYTESVSANVENISIRSYSGNPADTIVQHIGSGCNFNIAANNVTISGFNITGAGSTGIYMTGYYSGANIRNNKLSGVGCGVQLEGSSYCTMVNNTVNDSAQHGFYLSSSSNCTLANNIISNTSSYGVYLFYSNYCTFTNNTVSDTDSDGVYLLYSNYCTFTNNAVSDTDSYGIRLYGSGHCSFANNTVLNTDYNGIYLENSGNCNLTGNSISNTNYNGIYFGYSGNCNLTGNSISNTNYDGIYFYYSGNCNLTSNTVSNNYESGIDLYNSENCTLTSNMVSNTDDEGIYLSKCNSSTLTSNTVSDSYGGIYIHDSNECILSNNTASSGISGLEVSDCKNCTLTDNCMSGNWYNFGFSYEEMEEFGYNYTTGCVIDTSNLVDGKPIYFFEKDPNPTIGKDAGTVYCISCGYVEVKDLVLQNNSFGIFLYNTSSNVEHNTISNTECGIGVNSPNVSISDNEIENSLCGIALSSAVNVTVADNTIRDSPAGIYIYYSENCTFESNCIQNCTTYYYLYSALTGNEENSLTGENSSLTSNLVQGAGSSAGIYSYSSQNLSFENNIIDNAYDGIILRECQNAGLLRNSVRNIVDIGIYSYESSDVGIERNTVQNVTGEVSLDSSGDVSLVGSYASYGFGIYSLYSSDVRIVGNSVRDIGRVGIYTKGNSGVELLDNTVQNVTGMIQVYESGNSLVGSSLVSIAYAPTGYGIYSDDSSVPKLESTLVAESSSSGIRVEGNTVKDSYQVWGIYLYEPVNATIEENTVRSCKGGLIAYMSENSSISGCSVTNCSSGGILVINSGDGLEAEYTVSDCTVDGSYLGLVLTGEGTFTGNTLSGNSYGLVLYGVNNSLIYDNTLEENSLAGIVFDINRSVIDSQLGGLVQSLESPEIIISGNNTIYNNYFKNTNNTVFYGEGNNTWNTSKISGESIVGGPYLGGNYWANIDGTGFSENCTDADKDGIADSSYEIVNGTFDYLPLTEIPSTTTKHKSSANYIPSGGSTGVTGVDSAQRRVAAGTQTSFNFNNPVSGILGISFTPLQYSGNVIVRIEVLGSSSSGDGPAGEIYQQMNILVGNDRFDSESNINGASLSFRVSKSWVEENNIDISTITINRYHNDEWNALVTEMTSEDDEYYYFTAETPGFSKYAITGDKLGSETITSSEESENSTVTGDEQTTAGEKKSPGFESIFVALGILASVFIASKRILK